jgi:CubicO group peptidase (beta-lactamase class C family)
MAREQSMQQRVLIGAAVGLVLGAAACGLERSDEASEGLASTTQAVTTTPTSADIDEVVLEELVKQNLQGVAIGVIHDNEIIHLKGYGYADFEEGELVTTSTPFRWASISKPLTALAAMQLVEEGKLDLDEDIRNYLPTWSWPPCEASCPSSPDPSDPGCLECYIPDAGYCGDDPNEFEDRRITMRHLLSNQSGIGNYSHLRKTIGYSDYDTIIRSTNYVAENYDANAAFDASSAVALFNHAPLMFVPGHGYRYSTFGFTLAGAVIDHITQDEHGGYVGFIEERFVSDVSGLGLSSLRPDYLFASPPDRVKGYELTCSQEVARQRTTDVSFKLPGGGWMSNVEDLTRLAHELLTLEQGIISEASRGEMWQNLSTRCGSGADYGLGFRVNTEKTYVRHGGDQENTRTQMALFPAAGVAVVVMSNSVSTNQHRIANRIAHLFGLRQDVSYPPSPPISTRVCSARSLVCPNGPPRQFSGFWQSGDTETVVRRDYDLSSFLREVSALRERGWHLTDLEPHDAWIDEERRYRRFWGGMFKKNDRRTTMLRNFTTASFTDRIAQLEREGYRLIDIETYVGIDLQEGERLWSGLVVREPGGQRFRQGMTTTEFRDAWRRAVDDGYRLVDLEVYVDDRGDRRWAFLAHEGSGAYAVYFNQSHDDFYDLVVTLRDQGLRLVDMESYRGIGSQAGKRLWAGLWRTGTGEENILRNWDYCGFTVQHEHKMARGLELIDLEHHD